MTDDEIATLARGRVKVIEEGEHHAMIVLSIGGVKREIPLTTYTLPCVAGLLVEAIQNAEAPLVKAMGLAMKTAGISAEVWDILYDALEGMKGVTPIEPAAPGPATHTTTTQED